MRFGMRKVYACCLALAVVAGAVEKAVAQSEERQLRDLFNLQWMQASQGRPEEVSGGAPGQLILTAAASSFVTTNPQLLPEGSPADIYFNPWVSAEWRKPFARGASGYAGAAFVDYQYVRFPELNYAFAKVWTGLSARIARGKVLSLDGYVTAAFDYDLTSRFSNDDFEMPLTVGMILNADLGHGQSFYLTPEFKVMGALPRDSWSKSYISQTLTAGWTWQITTAFSMGAYWSGSVHHYPIDLNQTDFTQYLGATCELQLTSALAMALNCVQTLNASTATSSRYSDLSASLTLRVSFPPAK